MRHDFYLAWRYLRHHRWRSLILIACFCLMAFLPLALHRLLEESERHLLARAEATPLLIGAKGSAVDLTLSTLYFGFPPPSMTLKEAERITTSGWSEALPIYLRLRIHGQPLVGVTLDYFDFRRLAVATGQLPALLGECILGAEAAERLGLKPGDTLPTTPENLFDLAGLFPLKLQVVGVLAKTFSPDDAAIFVDLNTAWVIDGLGHGHTEGKSSRSESGLPIGPSADKLDASRLLTYTEITPDNLDSFHFHCDPSTYPISAVIALPHDTRTATLLRGRYLDESDPAQIVRPADVVRSLLETIFRLGEWFDAVLLLVGSATLLLIALVFTLSLRLRQREIETVFLLGCSRLTVVRLVAAEIMLIALASGTLCLVLLECTQRYAEVLIKHLIIH